MKKQTWIVKIQCADRVPLWAGNFEASGREEAKREARLFVSKHFPSDTMLLAVARGSVSVTIEGDQIAMDAEERGDD